MATISEIQNFTRFLCDANTDSYTAANLLITNNLAYEDVVGKILLADGRWQFDDNNFTTFPIATTTLVSGQRDYTFDVSHLRIERVEILDQNGDYYKLDPRDLSDSNVSDTEYSQGSGRPSEYDVRGSSILLDPPPDAGISVTLAAGLKVFFQRTADVFTAAQVTTGTKVPGFASPFHMLIAYKSALPYCLKYKPERVQAIQLEVDRMERKMVEFYSKRNKDESAVVSMARVIHR